MIAMTFEQYDELYNELLEVEIDDDFTFPDLSMIPHLLATNDGFRTVMLAYLNTPDKAYRNGITRIMTQLIELTDEADGTKGEKKKRQKRRFTQEQHQKIIEMVKSMDFQPYGYYPSIEEIKTHVTVLNEENLAFLYWLINTQEELSSDEEKTKTFLMSYIAQLSV